MGGTAQFLWRVTTVHRASASSVTATSSRLPQGQLSSTRSRGKTAVASFRCAACDTRRKEKQPTADFGTVRPLCRCWASGAACR